METLIAVAIVVVALLVALWWRRREAKKVTVFEHEAGVKYVRGKLVSVLGAGRHATWPSPIDIVKVDLREQVLTVPSQEMLTADQLSLRMSLIAVYRVIDARAYQSQSATPYARLYQAVQVALRTRIAARALDELLADRADLAAGLAEAANEEARPMGLEVKSVRVLDLSLAGPVKQAYADLWKAQKEGLAALERARGEQSALRALANAARMLKGNPELMNLRLLQTLAAPPGRAAPTVVLGGASGLLPVAATAENGADAEQSPG